ncbi:hypothetical protein CHLRE_07g327317v5 [Chlamydomonas reinhardtii]|uniref:Uncharacterized protein n=1 Tax=Chlamydomonas reinhardtii TaxID=3055 RepID=A0A2K3DJL8_CHLRE|nr:uncharacterized protein CHLRE_07g327317v5 [Chlamydomonas reinhardtii]PNW80726.1 hypothetical protein CHLRE_07g327317v5 [Chlamydomonas reinhardtii]
MALHPSSPVHTSPASSEPSGTFVSPSRPAAPPPPCDRRLRRHSPTYRQAHHQCIGNYQYQCSVRWLTVRARWPKPCLQSCAVCVSRGQSSSWSAGQVHPHSHAARTHMAHAPSPTWERRLVIIPRSDDSNQISD